MQEHKRQKIILVDDVQANLNTGKSILEPYYDVYALSAADKLFEALKRVMPDIILLDIEMPGINGYEAMMMLKADKRYADIPVIFVAENNSEPDDFDGLALGAVDYICKPFSAKLLMKRVANHLLTQKQKAFLQDFNDNLLQMVEEKTRQIFGLQNAIIGTVADMVEFRDNSTGLHASRTRKYLQALVDQLMADGVYADELLIWNTEVVFSSAQLHDVGKISISDAILNKPAKLTPEEFEIMKSHVPRGVEAINKMKRFGYFADFLDYAKTIAGTHHEKWDGSGYPRGLQGEEIPLAGRIMAIADVYDALISFRPYKQAFSAVEAGRIIIAGSGTHFDPAIVDVFRKLTGEFAAIAREYR